MSKIQFTKAAIQAQIKSAAGERRVVRDAQQPGLVIDIRPGGSATFYLYRRIDGRPTRLKIGRFPERTIEQARKLAAKHLGQVAEGRNPQRELLALRRGRTLGSLFDHWLLHAKAHKKTWAEDERIFNTLLSSWKARRLSEISKADVQARHSQIGAKNGRYAANRALALLRSMFNKADEIGFTGANPARGVKLFAEKQRDRFLLEEEMPAWHAALKQAEPIFQDFFMIALLTGARRGNVQSMRWADVRLSAAMWRIPETKSGEIVVVHLPDEVIEILERRKAEANGSPFVFATGSKSGYLKEPSKAWAKITEAAGLPDLRIHDLRRTLGSWQAINGASLPIIGKSLGHKSLAATAIYARLSTAPVALSVDAATNALLKAAKPKKKRKVKS